MKFSYAAQGWRGGGGGLVDWQVHASSTKRLKCALTHTHTYTPRHTEATQPKQKQKQKLVNNFGFGCHKKLPGNLCKYQTCIEDVEKLRKTEEKRLFIVVLYAAGSGSQAPATPPPSVASVAISGRDLRLPQFRCLSLCRSSSTSSPAL